MMEKFSPNEVAHAEILAEKILAAAGSGLRHYVPATKSRIISVAKNEISAIKMAEVIGRNYGNAALSAQRAVEIGVLAGFMLSTAHGQDNGKLMPVSDATTLQNFARMLLQEVGK